MDKIQTRFKEIDLQVLLEKKKIVLEELARENEFILKLTDLLDRINQSFMELSKATYDSD